MLAMALLGGAVAASTTDTAAFRNQAAGGGLMIEAELDGAAGQDVALVFDQRLLGLRGETGEVLYDLMLDGVENVELLGRGEVSGDGREDVLLAYDLSGQGRQLDLRSGADGASLWTFDVTGTASENFDGCTGIVEVLPCSSSSETITFAWARFAGDGLVHVVAERQLEQREATGLLDGNETIERRADDLVVRVLDAATGTEAGQFVVNLDRSVAASAREPLEAVDANGDGVLDLLVTASQSIEVGEQGNPDAAATRVGIVDGRTGEVLALWQDPRGSVGDVVAVPVGDLDGDGTSDVAVDQRSGATPFQRVAISGRSGDAIWSVPVDRGEPVVSMGVAGGVASLWIDQDADAVVIETRRASDGAVRSTQRMGIADGGVRAEAWIGDVDRDGRPDRWLGVVPPEGDADPRNVSTGAVATSTGRNASLNATLSTGPAVRVGDLGDPSGGHAGFVFTPGNGLPGNAILARPALAPASGQLFVGGSDHEIQSTAVVRVSTRPLAVGLFVFINEDGKLRHEVQAQTGGGQRAWRVMLN